MTTVLNEAELEWDLADYLHKALRVSGVGAGEMAEYLGVHRTSVSNWLSGRTEPRIGMLRLWALRTGVPLEWLARPKGFEPLTS